MPTVLRPSVNATLVSQPVAPPPAAPPPAPPAKKLMCIADFEKDGSLTVQFVVSAEMAKRFVRQANGRDLATFLWDTRGLRHFEHQPLI